MRLSIIIFMFLLSAGFASAKQMIEVVSENGEQCQVFVDCVPIGFTPATCMAPTGKHRVEVVNLRSGDVRGLTMHTSRDSRLLHTVVFDPVRNRIYRLPVAYQQQYYPQPMPYSQSGYPPQYPQQYYPRSAPYQQPYQQPYQPQYYQQQMPYPPDYYNQYQPYPNQNYPYCYRKYPNHRMRYGYSHAPQELQWSGPNSGVRIDIYRGRTWR